MPSLPGVGSDIKKPGVTELSYDRVPVRAAATLPQIWRDTARHLPDITQPVLVFRSSVDHVVGSPSMKALEAGLAPGLLTAIRRCSGAPLRFGLAGEVERDGLGVGDGETVGTGMPSRT